MGAKPGQRARRAPTVAVGGVALDGQGRVLLVRRGRPPAKGYWTIPGGRVKLGEELHVACARELAEETGLDVEVGPVVTVLDRLHRDPAGGVRYHFVIVDFLVTARGGTLRPGGDVTDARWVAPADLDSLPTTRGLGPVIDRALALAASAR